MAYVVISLSDIFLTLSSLNHFMRIDLITVSYPFLYHTCGHSVSSGYTHPALHFDVLPVCYL